MTTPRLALVICVAAAALPVRPFAQEAETPPAILSGVVVADGRTRLALTDPATKTTTWVEAGGEFNGWSVARYDDENEAVFLRRGTDELRVPLVTAKTEDPSPATTATLAPAVTPPEAVAAIQSNLRRLVNAAQRLRLERSDAHLSYHDLVGPGKPLPSLTPVAGENYSTLGFGPEVTGISVTTANGETIAIELPPPPVFEPAVPASANPALAPSAPTPLPTMPSGPPAGSPTGDTTTPPTAATPTPTAPTSSPDSTTATPPVPPLAPEPRVQAPPARASSDSEALPSTAPGSTAPKRR